MIIHFSTVYKCNLLYILLLYWFRFYLGSCRPYLKHTLIWNSPIKFLIHSLHPSFDTWDNDINKGVYCPQKWTVSLRICRFSTVCSIFMRAVKAWALDTSFVRVHLCIIYLSLIFEKVKGVADVLPRFNRVLYFYASGESVSIGFMHVYLCVTFR